MAIRTAGILGVSALALAAVSSPALAATNLVTNGGFETTSLAASGQVNTSNVTGWSVNGGYTFLYLPQAGTTSGSSADNSGASGQYGTVKLWGPGDGSANGLINSPAGSNFIAQDDNFQQAAITQTIGGLVVGTGYQLQFYWGGVAQQSFGGTTQENWQVSFGGQSYTTPTVNPTDKQFSGWMQASYSFTATSTSQVLSFLATGTPGGAPPFSLLDGVSLVSTPEPATWAVMLAGIVGLGFVVRRRGSLGVPTATA